MSGEATVYLPGPAMLPLIRAAVRLGDANLGAFAVIGGVAVSAGWPPIAPPPMSTPSSTTTARPTCDVLHPSPGAPTRPIGIASTSTGRRSRSSARAPSPERDLDGLDDRQIHFVAAHRWALETATPVTLIGDDGTRATLPMARPSALVAMKLHAIQDRRLVGGIDKRGSDAWDIYRLITDLDVDVIATELRSMLPSLTRVVVAAANDILVDSASRTRGWLRTGDAEMASVGSDDLIAAGMDLIERITVRVERRTLELARIT